MEQQNDQTPSLEDFFRIFKRGLLLATIGMFLAAGGIYLLSQTQEPLYQARSTILAAQSSPDLRTFDMSLVTASPLDANSYSLAATSTPVLESALEVLENEDMGNLTVRQLRGSTRVRTEVGSNTTLIHIDVSDPVPEVAARKADAVAAALLRWDAGRAQYTLNTVITTLENQVAALATRINQLNTLTEDSLVEDERIGLATLRAQQQTQLGLARALSHSVVGLLEVIEPATTPRTPISPRPVRNAVLASILTFALVYVVVLLRDALNTRLRDLDELAQVSGLPVLAEFSKLPQKAHRLLPREPTGYLRTNLLSATADAHPKIILVTSALPGEGKSRLALSLAASFATNKNRTLLVDADLRNPVSGYLLDLDPQPSRSLQKHLENPHEREGNFRPASVAVGTAASLDVIPSFGPASYPAELLGRSFHLCIKKWLEDYDVIIIDSPPVLPVADALTIAPLCTGTLLAIDLKRTDRRQLQTAIRNLQRLSAPLLGLVVTNSVGVRSTKLAGRSYKGEDGELSFNKQNPGGHEGAMGPSQF